MSNLKPMCFVLMPFGTKPDPAGGPPIPFDRIYSQAIRPAIEDAGLEPIRADEESASGIIHKAMFERLLLCEFAIADLTTANANVFYELGVRHAGRPSATVSIFARQQTIPFDLNFLRGIPYDLGKDNGFDNSHASTLRANLTRRLIDLRARALVDLESDSPVFQLIEDWRPVEVSRLKTDVFRERAHLQVERKRTLSKARSDRDLESLQRFEGLLRAEHWSDLGSCIDLMLSFRALSAWNSMVKLIESFPGQLRRLPMVREQLAFALNRRCKTPEGCPDDRGQAIELLQGLIAEAGPTSESCGLLGRIYKDQWKEERTRNPFKAKGYLKKAIDTYRAGFDSDWRDAYPGVNAVTLMFVSEDPQMKSESSRLAPIVRYAVNQRLRGKSPDYWDYATLLELAVVARESGEATDALEHALAALREPWEAQTTADNLQLLQNASGDSRPWLSTIIGMLREAGEQPEVLRET
jgi:hypothetical protein